MVKLYVHLKTCRIIINWKLITEHGCELPSSYSLGVRGDMWHLTCDTWHLTCDTWHLTPEIWHLTPDMWHMTYDMCHVTHRGWWTLCQNFRSLALMVWVWRCLQYSEQKDDQLNQLMQWISDKGVCRTAPAKPGLLKSSSAVGIVVSFPLTSSMS